jgi:hypothetical protein
MNRERVSEEEAGYQSRFPISAACSLEKMASEAGADKENRLLAIPKKRKRARTFTSTKKAKLYREYREEGRYLANRVVNEPETSPLKEEANGEQLQSKSAHLLKPYKKSLSSSWNENHSLLQGPLKHSHLRQS